MKFWQNVIRKANRLKKNHWKRSLFCTVSVQYAFRFVEMWTRYNKTNITFHFQISSSLSLFVNIQLQELSFLIFIKLVLTSSVVNRTEMTGQICMLSVIISI